jgi:tetratricopeptide (TPR) repeat protein
VLAALVAYQNSFSGVFVFDDQWSITENLTIRHLWPVWRALWPPADSGLTVSGRPVLNFSLAVNFAISGKNVWSYHALNLGIHVFAGLALFGVVRRTLAGTAGAQACLPRRSQPASRQSDATLLALAIALLWTLHPLQTESVTYVIQRSESLMGLCYLLTLYCFIRGIECLQSRDNRAGAPAALQGICHLTDDIVSRRSGRIWFALSVMACLLGMGCKEVMVTAPLMVLLYDRTFVAGSFRSAWKQRPELYLWLAATWIPLGGLVASTGGNRGGTSGVVVGVSPWAYWLTQFEAIPRYLGLSFWPHPLVFDYGTFWFPGIGAVIPEAVIVLVLVTMTAVALRRWPAAGFLGCWFFAILGPTSLTPGTIQMIVEHRMYLPLAAVVMLAVMTMHRWLGRYAIAASAAIALAFAWLTVTRNRDYRSELALWDATVAQRPRNARAQSNLGRALFAQDRTSEAIRHYEAALHLDPKAVEAHYNLGLAQVQRGRMAEAAAQFAEAIRYEPRLPHAHFELGLTLMQLGRIPEAMAQFSETLTLKPDAAEAHCNLGICLAEAGRFPEAVAHYEDALRLDPNHAEAECNLAAALFRLSRIPEAIRHAERSLVIKPDQDQAHFNLGLIMAATGRRPEAAAHYEAALKLKPGNAVAQLNLGITLAQMGRSAEALPHLEQAARLQPDLAETHCNLGICLAVTGRLPEAVEQYEQALRLQPDYAVAHYNLGNALLELRRVPEAAGHFEQAVRLEPRFDAARDMLARLRTLSPPP